MAAVWSLELFYYGGQRLQLELAIAAPDAFKEQKESICMTAQPLAVLQEETTGLTSGHLSKGSPGFNAVTAQLQGGLSRGMSCWHCGQSLSHQGCVGTWGHLRGNFWFPHKGTVRKAVGPVR